jgi:hypothetical protein
MKTCEIAVIVHLRAFLAYVNEKLQQLLFGHEFCYVICLEWFGGSVLLWGCLFRTDGREE